MKWIAKKVKSLFPLKDKNIYPYGKIYQGDCVCKNDYIGETERNLITRWGECNNPAHDT